LAVAPIGEALSSCAEKTAGSIALVDVVRQMHCPLTVASVTPRRA